MDSMQNLTPKPSSEVDTEHEEEMQGMAGPSSAQNQRRRFGFFNCCAHFLKIGLNDLGFSQFNSIYQTEKV